MLARPIFRLPFLLPAILCLLAGVLTGLARMGVPTTDFIWERSAVHSTLMISGFFGTVIGLERSVASQRIWPYLAPLLSGLGGLTLLYDQAMLLSPGLFTAAAIIFGLASVQVIIKQPALHNASLLVAALLWLAGNSLWLGSGNPWTAIPYGLSFLVLTIAGERLELTRFLPPRPGSRWFFVIIGVLIIGATIWSGHTAFTQNTGLGLAYAALALWLIVYDIARKTIRTPGITRFVAICLLSGYLWLLLGGLLSTDIWQLGAFQRDASVHAIALGFIFAMVIGHAPIIFPAVMRVAIPFSTIFYLPLALVQIGVALRLLAAVQSHAALREIGGIVNALAILSFFLCLLTQVVRGFKQRLR